MTTLRLLTLHETAHWEKTKREEQQTDDRTATDDDGAMMEPVKTLCRNYEKRLSAIRAACFQNRAFHRSLAAHARLVERTLSAVTNR